MSQWVILIPSLPLLAALVVGGLHVAGCVAGERGEVITRRISTIALALAVALIASIAWQDWRMDGSRVVHHYGNWLGSRHLQIGWSFTTAMPNIALAALFSVLLLIGLRFAANYLHREPGFHRFFALLNLFAAAMMTLVLAGNAVLTFFGWEIAGVCSYLLVAYAYDRPQAAYNATRIFITNRVGDVGFLLAIALSALWLETTDWQAINQAGTDLDRGDATLLALGFVLAALVKSAQLPFSPWLARAMEGPTPSSALFYGGVMIHSGVFLVIQLQPLLTQTPVALSLLTVIGALTAVYGYLVGLTQTDIKSSHAFASLTQIGLMFLACGLGFWTLAAWHLAAHAVVRCYLLLTAPSILHASHDLPPPSIGPALARCRWAFVAALQRGWLEPAIDWLTVKPLQRLANDMRYIDDHLIDPALGAPVPAMRAMSSLAQWQEQKAGANLQSDSDSFAQGSGLAGKLAQGFAGLMHWFEYRFILRGIGRDTIRLGRRLGHAANRFERMLLRPRYITLFVLVTLLVALDA